MTTAHMLNRSTLRLRILLFALCMGSMIGVRELPAQACGESSPARAVAKCVDASGTPISCGAFNAIQLWPVGFRPGGVDDATIDPNPLPMNRDTTDRVGGLTVPGSRSGHEIFRSVDVVGDHLYVAYNAGIQVWDIGLDPELESPSTGPTSIKDGWEGHFWSFPPVSEQLNFIEDIDALNFSSGVDMVAVSGKVPAGLTLWKHDTTLRQIYQDVGTSARQVRIVKFNGTTYVFASTPTGVVVYNATAASNLICTPSCIDDKGSTYPGVYRGALPHSVILGRYLDVVVASGAVYVMATDGNFRPIEIWRLTNPAVPSSAQLLYSGQGLGARGLAFIPYPDATNPQTLYAAFVQNDIIKILKLNNACFGLGAGCDLETCNPVAGGPACEIPASTFSADEQFLTYTMSGTTPYLYYGVSSFNISGPGVEQLLNLSDLGKTALQLQQQGFNGPRFPEITEGGGTYTDACNGEEIGYWADYYPRNDKGLRNMNPRVAKFGGPNDAYLYRAAEGILDVHIRGDIVLDPTITVAVQSPNPDPQTGAYWMGEEITLTASAQNCTPSGLWAWAESTALPVTGLASTTNVAQITWNYCAGNPCPDENVTVMAQPQSGCGLAPTLLQTPNPLPLKDPRPQIVQINVEPDQASYPAGVELTFTADQDGKSPFTYAWAVKDAGQQVIETGMGDTFVWQNTCVALVAPDRIFTDGFESGNLSAWSEGSHKLFRDAFETGDVSSWSFLEGAFLVSAPSQPTKLRRQRRPAPQARRKSVLAGLAENQTYSVELTLSNGLTPDAQDMTQITLEVPGALVFDTPAIGQTDLGNGSFTLQANSQNATEWKWEIEDPNGGGNCEVYQTCQAFDWGEEDQELIHSWLQEGTFGVTVWIRNSCAPEIELSAADSVQVDEVVVEPLTMTQFQVDVAENGVDCSFSLGFVDCLVNRQVTFVVAATGRPTSFKVDWNGTGVYATVAVPAGGKIFHTYTSTLPTFRPKIRAVKGVSESADRSLLTQLTIKSSL